MKNVTLRLILLVSMMLLALSANIVSAQESIVTSTTSAVNLRSGPGTEWRIVGTAPAGTTVALDGQAFGGNWVRGITSGGIVGWMFTQNLVVSEAEAGTLRQIWVEEPFNLSAPAQQGGTGGATTLTTTADVNIRTGWGTEWRILGQVAQGTPVNVDGRSPGGNWVRGATPDGTIGWIASAYVAGNVAGLPVINRVDQPFGGTVPSGGEVPADDSASDTPSVDAPPPIVSTSPVSGFNLGGHVSGYGENTFNWMRVAGMTWLKKQVRWEPGNSPDGVRGLIEGAHASGFKILLGIVGDGGRVNDGGYMDAYAEYVGGVAAIGADAIEVWNEPNIDREWAAGSINPASYTTLLAKSFNAIKSRNPNTMVISGAPAPTGFFGGCSGAGCDDDKYLAGMAAAGAANYMDCVGIHYNEGIVPPNWTSGDPRGSSNHYSRYLQTMMSVYSGAFGGSRPLCFTELGYLSPEGYGPLPPGFQWAVDTSVAEQAAWLDQAVSIAANSGRVRLLIVWNVDFTNYGADPMAGYAMIRPGNNCPACFALGN